MTHRCPECGHTTLPPAVMPSSYRLCPICGCHFQPDDARVIVWHPAFYVARGEISPGRIARKRPYWVVMEVGKPDACLATTRYERAVEIASAWERGERTPAWSPAAAA